MNCPKCGNYVEDGKTYCFMCGTKIGNSDFSSPGRIVENPSLNEDYYRKKEEYKNRLRNYREPDDEEDKKKKKLEKKDIFDIFEEYNTLIKVGFLLFVVVLGVFILYRVSVRNNRDKVLKPVIGKLYYEVDSALESSSSNNGAVVYNLSKDKGTSCSISVAENSSTSGDYVKEKFESIENYYISLIKYDNEMRVENNIDIPLFQSDSFVVNNVTWNYLYVFYRKSINDDYNHLKYRHLSVGYRQSFYDISLVNNDDTDECNAYLDSFIRSLKFISE